MKRLFLIILSIFLLVGIVYAKGVYYYGSETVSGAVSYIHDIPCDDNAATTVVTNDGTKANWTSNRNTEDFGDGSKFNMINPGAGNNPRFYLADWDEEKFELIMKVYINDADATSENHELWFQVGDGDAVREQNEILMYRLNADDEITVGIFGDDAADSEKIRTTNDWNPNVTTWYWIKLIVNATANPWTVTVASSTDGTSYTTLTWAAGDWDTGHAASWTNDTGHLGDSSGSALYEFEGYFDAITIEDKS